MARFFHGGGWHGGGWHGGQGGIGRRFFGGGFRPGFRGFGRGRWSGRRWGGLWQPPAPAPTPNPQVQWVQSCLAQSVDPSVPQDGFLGPQTQQAIRTFQSQHQLPPTGVLDPTTTAALQAACSGQQAGGSQGAQPGGAGQAGPPQGGPPGGGGGGRRPHPPQQEIEFRPSRRWEERRHSDDRWGLSRERRWPWLFEHAEPGGGEEGEFFLPFFGGSRRRRHEWRGRHREHRPWDQPEDQSEYEVRPSAVARPVFEPRREPVEVRRERFEPRRAGLPFAWREGRRWEGRPGRPEGFRWREPSHVLWAQSCLAQLLGPWVVRDGVLGPNTAAAVQQFQQQQSLTPTGLLDEQTVSALHAACGG